MKGFDIIPRYSLTDNVDKHGRWARLVFYNGALICWITKIIHIDYGLMYKVTDYFPSLSQDNPTHVATECQKNFDTILEETKERFLKFKDKINE